MQRKIYGLWQKKKKICGDKNGYEQNLWYGRMVFYGTIIIENGLLFEMGIQGDDMHLFGHL